MHITRDWQDASAGFKYIILTTDHHQHSGGTRGIEARMRQSPTRPATGDQGDALFVKAQVQQVVLPDTSYRLWLKAALTQFDAVIRLSEINTLVIGDSVSAYQLRRALAVQGTLDEAYAGVGDLDAIPRIQWDSAGIVDQNDELSSNIQATLEYSFNQMAELFELARTFPPKAWS